MISKVDMPALILLVDDELMVRDLLGRALKADGYEVVAVGTKKEAFAHLSKRKFDLLIVDKNLPDGSGLEIISGARDLNKDGESILVTGYSDTDSAIWATNLGVFRYVLKPLDLDTLRVDIHRALEANSLRTSIRDANLELERANSDLREAIVGMDESERRRMRAERLATVGSLAAGVAHEINNPLGLLSMIIPYTVNELGSLLESGDVEQEPEQAAVTLTRMHKSLRSAQEAVEFLMGLSLDLHSLGKPEQEYATPVNLLDAAGSAFRLVRHRLKNKATLVLEIPENLTVLGHSKRLVQVFINLLTNAGKAIFEEDAPGLNMIAIRGRLEDSEIIIDVSDTGVGIPKENIDKIFTRFFTTTSPGEQLGSGIGLSIVKEIIEEHGGSLAVSNEQGNGTTFTIKFPVIADRPDIMGIPAVARTGAAEMTRTRRKILFVDSETGNLEAYEESFGQLHDVYLSRTAQEARTLVDQINENLDVVVCELVPDEHPLVDFHNNIVREYSELKDRFIFLGDPSPLTDGALEQGRNVLLKPVRPAVLLAAVYKIPPRRPSTN
jgi:signal transduction histidine kinase